MSLGYVGYAEKAEEDEKIIFYAYGSENWNEIEHKNEERIKDGSIIINKSTLPAIEVVEKIKRLSGDRKIKIVNKNLRLMYLN